MQRAFASIAAQRFDDWELLCVQDGNAPDVTREIIRLTQQDRRVRYLPRGCVGSIGAACNHALQQATGEYVAILDDDDEWIDPEKLRLQVQFLDRKPEYVGCGGGYRSVDQDERVLGRYFKPQEDADIRRSALLANPMANSTTMFRRKTALEIGGYSEKVPDFQDWEFWLRCLLQGKLYNFHRVWLNYTVWEGGSSFVNMRSNAWSALQIVRHYRDRFPQGGLAMVMARSYDLYARLPHGVRSFTYASLSLLKKRVFASWRGREFGLGEYNLPANPTVSVIVPCLNGARLIGKLVESFRRCEKDGVIEILVVDGGSTDGTLDLMHQHWSADPFVKVLTNPFRHKPHGMNIGIAQARGDIVLVADTHAIYSADYVERCVETLLGTGAMNAGGAQRYVAKTPVQYFVALAVRTRTGSGRARYKDPTYSGFADTVYLGCFVREALQQVGKRRQPGSGRRSVTGQLEIFSEANITNQDAEINERLSEIVEFPVYVNSEIVVYYYPRSRWSEVLRQYFRYGRGRCITSVQSRKILVRGNLPFAAVSAATILAVLDWIYPVTVAWIFFFAAIVGVGADCASALWRTDINAIDQIWKRDGVPPPNRVTAWLGSWLMILIMNITHGIGFAYQVAKNLMQRRASW